MERQSRRINLSVCRKKLCAELLSHICIHRKYINKSSKILPWIKWKFEFRWCSFISFSFSLSLYIWKNILFWYEKYLMFAHVCIYLVWFENLANRIWILALLFCQFFAVVTFQTACKCGQRISIFIHSSTNRFILILECWTTKTDILKYYTHKLLFWLIEFLTKSLTLGYFWNSPPLSSFVCHWICLIQA